MGIVLGQQLRCSAADRDEFDKRIEQILQIKEEDAGKAMVAIGRTFMGTPYVAQTLEGEGTELLVVNLRGLDCTTFVENVLAFQGLRREKDYSFESFTHMLQDIRYRQGSIEGYPSRLHYFTEWISNNEKKGWVRDMTEKMGGKRIDKKRNFMSSHRKAYPALRQDTNYKGILEVEKALAHRPYYIVEPEKFEVLESYLRDGDIIAFATSINGLDVTHTGLAICRDDRIHLLHASSSGQVEISEQPLIDYARGISGNTGLIIARVIQ